MPGAGFQRHASKLAHIVENELVNKPYEIARQKLVSYAGHQCPICPPLMKAMSS
jgi:hypothetical protein